MEFSKHLTWQWQAELCWLSAKLKYTLSELNWIYLTTIIIIFCHPPSLHLSPHPRCNVLNASQSTYCLFWNRWFWQFSFEGHRVGLHSNWSMRFRQLASGPHAFSLSPEQSHTGSSEGSISIRTAVVHLFTYNQKKESLHLKLVVHQADPYLWFS